MEREVKNILGAFNSILDELILGKSEELITPDTIRRFHRKVGEGLGESFAAEPGAFRRSNVFVGDYRPPSFEEVPALVDRLCEWLDREFHFRSGQSFEDAMVEAIIAHIYIEWIHPFGDGNGRKSRLLEFFILMRSEVPNIASHLLSNYYNDTRAEYYRRIAEATLANDLSGFVAYAASGLRDGLQKVFETIQQSLFAISWESYVHEEIGGLKEKGDKDTKIRRLRSLALAIPSDRSVAFGDIALLTPKVAKEYSKMSKPTLSRDLSLLMDLKPVMKDEGGYRANIVTLSSFAPVATGRIG